MRWLAVARYRFLILIRRSRGIVPVLMIVNLLPLVGQSLRIVLDDDASFRSQAPDYLSMAGVVVVVVYAMHFMALVLLCWSFGTVQRRPESAKPSDLMDTAPISGQVRFWGDAAGIGMTVLAIHFCTAPLLAQTVAFSAFPSSMFWSIELVIMVVVAFVSTIASWMLRAETTGWSQTRSWRSTSFFLLLMMLIVIGTTRPIEFRDSLTAFLVQPSVRSWSFVVAAIQSLPLMMTLVMFVITSFVAYFAVQSARAVEG